jgi:membrane protein DedA with SNARE-associated domain
MIDTSTVNLQIKPKILYSSPTGVVWGAGCVLLGYGLSASLATIGNYLTYGPLLIIVLGIVMLAVVKLRRCARNSSPTRRDGITTSRDGREATEPVKHLD